MPLFLLALAGVIGVLLYRRRPLLSSAEIGGDARQMLNFEPFTLQPGRPVTYGVLTPSGLDPARAQAAINGTIGGMAESFQLTRQQIPVPAPGGASVAPAFADFWTVRCRTCRVPTTMTITPSIVLQEYLRRKGLPVTASVNVQPVEQMNGILYADALTSRVQTNVTPAAFIIAGRTDPF